ncbi:MAG: sulfur carrier protein ThiS [Bacteroidales bacterium]|jgi:thiamine biosynthesis protein ThiS|nr:sulfur carrier protein ThiS [Bacteroidales bacterium]
MKITLNNNQEIFKQESLTVRELLKVKNFTFKMLVIKINGRLVNKTDYETAQIHEGDEVHVLHLISGG